MMRAFPFHVGESDSHIFFWGAIVQLLVTGLYTYYQYGYLDK